MSGRSVLYVPCVSDQKRRFMQAMRANELGGLVLDLADPDTNGGHRQAADHGGRLPVRGGDLPFRPAVG